MVMISFMAPFAVLGFLCAYMANRPDKKAPFASR